MRCVVNTGTAQQLQVIATARHIAKPSAQNTIVSLALLPSSAGVLLGLRSSTHSSLIQGLCCLLLAAVHAEHLGAVQVLSSRAAIRCQAVPVR